MQRLIAFVLATSASVAFGIEANKFECRGEGVEVRVTPNGYASFPALSVMPTGFNSVNSPGGSLSDVNYEYNEMGLSICGHYTEIADATLVYTLMVPQVIVDTNGMKDVKGILIRTLGIKNISGASDAPQILQNNIFTPVVCEASHSML